MNSNHDVPTNSLVTNATSLTPTESYGESRMMNMPARRMITILVTAVSVTLLTARTHGQTITRIGSGVKAMFGSEGVLYRASDPTGITWGSTVIGTYGAGAVIPGLPVAPTPSIGAPGGNAFAAGGWVSIFNDGQPIASVTQAQSVIDDTVAALPVVTSDISIAIPGWRLFEASGASGYAYEQLNFGSNYLFTFNPGLGASASPNVPIFINGNVISGGSAYAQFDGVIDYTWFPVTVNTAGIIAPSGPSVSLGTLNYTFTQTGGGSFGLALLSTGGLLATPAGDGVLALDGHMWIAGDPFDFNVTTVPEPASLVLLGFGTLVLAARRRTGNRVSAK